MIGLDKAASCADSFISVDCVIKHMKMAYRGGHAVDGVSRDPAR